VWAAKLGYGDENAAFVHLNLVHAVDDTTSLPLTASSPAAFENLSGSLSFGIPFAEQVRLTGEVALAAFTNDERAPKTSDADNVPSFFFTPRTSTQIDGAAKLSLNLTPAQTWSLRLDAQWIGPGYRTLGYAQLQNDVFETVIAPTFRLFDSKLFLRGSLGLRYNNLRENRLSATRRIVGSFSASAQMTESVGLDLQYSNYGMRSTHRNDTLRVENVYQYISLSPRFTFIGDDMTHTLVLLYAFQDVSDNNPVSSQATQNQTHTASTIYTLAFPSSLVFTTSVFFNSVNAQNLTSNIVNLSETIGYQLFERSLSLSATAGVGFVNATGSDNQINGRFSATYQLERWGAFTLNVMVNNYSYGQASPTPSFTEVQGNLQYNLNF
jgi:hypothetical protein